MAVLADFTVETEYREGVPRRIRVVVYDSLKGMRIAASRYDNHARPKRHRRRGEHADTAGLCHRFEWTNRDESHPECAIVRLAEPHLGVGVTSHELLHAAAWIRELDGDPDLLTAENDEQLCWILGDLVRQAINGMNEHGVYDE